MSNAIGNRPVPTPTTAPVAETAAPPAAPAAPTPQALSAAINANPVNWSQVNGMLAQVHQDFAAGRVNEEQARAWAPVMDQVQAKAADADKADISLIAKIIGFILGIIPGIIMLLVDHFDGNSTAGRNASDLSQKMHGRAGTQPQQGLAPAGATSATTPTAPVRTTADGRPTPAYQQTLLDRADAYNPTAHTGAVPEARAREIQTTFRAAAEAERTGNYAEAARLYGTLGLPLADAVASQNAQGQWGWQLPENNVAFQTMVVLGIVNVTEGANGAWRAGGYSTRADNAGATEALNLNHLDSLAHQANMYASMMEMRTQPSPISQPPTEAQVMDYSRRVGERFRDNPEEGMRRLRLVVDGMLVHYSQAGGGTDPDYNQTAHRFMIRVDGEPRFFATQAEADAARTQLNTGRDRQHQIAAPREVGSVAPNEWSDLSSAFVRRGNPPQNHALGTDGGRSVSDCDGKRYLWSRMLEAAGGTTIGAADSVQGRSGHAYLVGAWPNGTTIATSNQQYAIVGPNGGPASRDAVMEQIYDFTRQVYNQAPRDRNGNDVDGPPAGHVYTIALGNPGMEATQRAGELRSIGQGGTRAHPSVGVNSQTLPDSIGGHR